jgi:hypothetical protein
VAVAAIGSVISFILSSRLEHNQPRLPTARMDKLLAGYGNLMVSGTVETKVASSTAFTKAFSPAHRWRCFSGELPPD